MALNRSEFIEEMSWCMVPLDQWPADKRKAHEDWVAQQDEIRRNLPIEKWCISRLEDYFSATGAMTPDMGKRYRQLLFDQSRQSEEWAQKIKRIAELAYEH